VNCAGQAVLVTGGGSGLGAATAEMLAGLGAKVGIVDVNISYAFMLRLTISRMANGLQAAT
jgi:NAD(P)-dependent dehydrogenase (short-subunit alcohol dehydrogenase family)